MKLYATTTSERASKGQGGNEYIHIDLKNEDNETIAKIAYTDSGISMMYLKGIYTEMEEVDSLVHTKGKNPFKDWNSNLHLNGEQLKGKSQKGEECICIDDTLDRHCIAKIHNW